MGSLGEVDVDIGVDGDDSGGRGEEYGERRQAE